jgi:hypothetical protein
LALSGGQPHAPCGVNGWLSSRFTGSVSQLARFRARKKSRNAKVLAIEVNLELFLQLGKLVSKFTAILALAISLISNRGKVLYLTD